MLTAGPLPWSLGTFSMIAIVIGITIVFAIIYSPLPQMPESVHLRVVATAIITTTLYHGL
jgi:hypothetical protein